MNCALKRLVGVGLLIPAVYLPAAWSECSAIRSYRDAINCVSQTAPEIRKSVKALQITEAEEDRARQFLNPELETRNLWSTGSQESGDFATETQILLPIELGGKRSARRGVAKAQKASALAYAQGTREKTLVETALAFHRLRQLETEIFLANEAIERFGRIVTTFRRRPQLNPEQSVSLITFRYAFEEEKQKKSQALSEQKSLLTDLALLLGQKIELKKEMFPQIFSQWPKVQVTDVTESAELKLAKARLEEAKSQRELAKAESWPDLKLGPSYERMPDRERTEERFGFGLTMELPVLSRNYAGRRSAELTEELSQFEITQAKKETNARLSSLIEQYQLITEALISAPSQAELEKGHRNFESHFSRGLVSYSLIIEAHRQLHDTVETKHKQELTALILLWSIYKLTGKLTPEAL